MSIFADPADTLKYSHFGTEVGDDLGKVLVEQHASGAWVRYYCRIFMVPSEQLFVLRHCTDSTEEDWHRAERTLAKMPAGAWARYDHWHRRTNSKSGQVFWKVFLGDFIEDPFAQLELEMMIDLERSPSTWALTS